jgi:hypothetical protein
MAIVLGYSGTLADNLSPLFGNETDEAFRMVQAEQSDGQAVAATVWISCGEAHCPPVAIFAKGTQEVAAAP